MQDDSLRSGGPQPGSLPKRPWLDTKPGCGTASLLVGLVMAGLSAFAYYNVHLSGRYYVAKEGACYHVVWFIMGCFWTVIGLGFIIEWLWERRGG